MKTNLLERLFHLRAAGTTAGREVLAGLGTFAAMVYCVAVNPAIMSNAGMDRASELTATCLIAIIASATMGLLANLPLGLAPAIGSNVVFAVVMVQQMGVPWPAALAIVCLTGIVFMILTVTRVRERMADGMPDCLRVGIQIAVGLTIMFIGLRNAGFVVANHTTLVTMGALSSPAVMLTFAGLVITPALLAAGVPGALIISIAGLTVIGLFVPDGHGGTITHWPTRMFAMPVWPSATAFHMDPGYIFHNFFYVLPVIIFFLCTELFGTLANLLGIASAGGMLRKDGSIPNATRAFAADAAGTILGPVLGTAVVAVYLESVIGVQMGGRTGLVAVVIALGFVAALFLWPLFMIIPPQATTPALVMVGILMFGAISRLDLKDMTQSVPAIMTFMFAVLTGNLLNGMAFGTFSYIVMNVAAGRWRNVTPTAWGLGLIMALFFIVSMSMRH
ncbi:NCS2 family permease [Komagataeibacter oboediens]|uniref:NCS2 family permease n=1 Tax=Komagataeibacter oboediens TaxID=65958 RepID=UPI0019048369|nr:NCS2 family permease [Komagataeibacter oboediens]GCE79100.1 xanthine/uracil transporter [Komagataeibacter oboediens]